MSIHHQYTSSNRYGKNPIYHLNIIQERSINEFIKNIGFISERKNNKLKERHKIREFEQNDVIPNQVDLLRSLYDGPGRGCGKNRSKKGANRELYRAIQHHLSGIKNSSARNLTRKRLKELLNKFAELRNEQLLKAANDEYFYSQVSEINTEREHTMDIMVPATGYFVANSILVHNKRRGANMAILRVDHPDIIDFITSKEKLNALNNFNISVALTDKFMKAVEKDEEYELINPHDKSVVKRLPARNVFDLIVLMAWKNGEPGIIFIDEMNRANPTPKIGEIESTNPCGEVPLLPYESCNLGSINLGKFVKNNKIEYDALREIIRKSVHFLDNVIDMNKFPLKKIEEMTKANRKIGLGVMGFADMLFQLGIAYNSRDGVETGRKVMKFICDEARKMSEELGKKRGSFPNFKDSIWASKYKSMRNATVTTIAPTGTLSMIADCSSGIEPLFAISFVKRVMDNKELVYVNEHFENYAKKEGFYSEELMKNIANKGSIQDIKEIPEEARMIFAVSHDIRPEWHINMQAAFQEHTDNAVSKTVNFPNWATTEDVKTVFLTAYKLGCKGVTVYRDGSRENQVLNIEMVKKEDDVKKKGKFLEKCPECGSKMKIQEGCSTCPQCGYSICSL